MKKLYLVAIAICMAMTGFAQNNAITKYFSAYKSDKNFTKVSITNEMFDLFTELDAEDPEEKEILDAMSKLEGMNGLFNDKVTDGIAMYQKALQSMASDTYKELMTVEDEKENVKFLIKRESGKIVELLMLNGAEKRFVVMSLFGEIDLKNIAKLARVMDIRGMDAFRALDDNPDRNKKK